MKKLDGKKLKNIAGGMDYDDVCRQAVLNVIRNSYTQTLNNFKNDEEFKKNFKNYEDAEKFALKMAKWSGEQLGYYFTDEQIKTGKL